VPASRLIVHEKIFGGAGDSEAELNAQFWGDPGQESGDAAECAREL
jgi:hypothetical protein